MILSDPEPVKGVVLKNYKKYWIKIYYYHFFPGCELPGQCYLKNVPMVIVQDLGGFEGIITAAHELGHL